MALLSVKASSGSQVLLQVIILLSKALEQKSWVTPESTTAVVVQSGVSGTKPVNQSICTSQDLFDWLVTVTTVAERGASVRDFK